MIRWDLNIGQGRIKEGPLQITELLPIQDDCFQGKIDSSNIPIEGTIAEGALDIPEVDTDEPEPVRRGRKPKHAEEA